ncbi:hypothetical protein ACVWXL_005166 [Bradyrhizobium sp. GM22.5]
MAFPSAGSYNTTPPTVAAFVSSYFRTFDERRLVIETCSWTTCRASTSPVGLGGQELSFGGFLASHRSILEQFTRLPRSTYGLGTNRRLRTRIPEYPFRLEFVPQWGPGRPFPGCREPCLRRGRGRSARRALHSQGPPASVLHELARGSVMARLTPAESGSLRRRWRRLELMRTIGRASASSTR